MVPGQRYDHTPHSLSYKTIPDVMHRMLEACYDKPTAETILLPDTEPPSIDGKDISFARQISNLERWQAVVDPSITTPPVVYVARNRAARPLLEAAVGVCEGFDLRTPETATLSQLDHERSRNDTFLGHACLLEPNFDNPDEVIEAAGQLRQLGYGPITVVRGSYFSTIDLDFADDVEQGTALWDGVMRDIGHSGAQGMIQHDIDVERKRLLES